MTDRICSLDECEKPARSGLRGMCSMHWTRWHRHGDPRVVLKPNGGRFQPREQHWNWADDDLITYRAAHNRIAKERGLARQHDCVDCGHRADEWSYNYGSPDERTDSLGLPYSTNLDDYSPRCQDCHARYDAAHRTRTVRPCVIKDCGRRAELYGMCSMHAARVKRHGDPMFTKRVLPRRTRPMQEGGSHDRANQLPGVSA